MAEAILPDTEQEYATPWPIWRVVEARFGSLEEIIRFWSLDDLLDAHVTLDLAQAINADSILRELGAVT